MRFSKFISDFGENSFSVVVREKSKCDGMGNDL